MVQVCQQVDGTCYDMEYDTQTVQNMAKVSQFPSINANIMRAIELKGKLDALESARKQRTPHISPTVPTTHIQSYGSIQSDSRDNATAADTGGLIPKVFD